MTLTDKGREHLRIDKEAKLVIQRGDKARLLTWMGVAVLFLCVTWKAPGLLTAAASCFLAAALSYWVWQFCRLWRLNSRLDQLLGEP